MYQSISLKQNRSQTKSSRPTGNGGDGAGFDVEELGPGEDPEVVGEESADLDGQMAQLGHIHFRPQKLLDDFLAFPLELSPVEAEGDVLRVLDASAHRVDFSCQRQR